MNYFASSVRGVALTCAAGFLAWQIHPCGGADDGESFKVPRLVADSHRLAELIASAGAPRGGLVAETRIVKWSDESPTLTLEAAVRNVHDRPVPVACRNGVTETILAAESDGVLTAIPPRPADLMARPCSASFFTDKIIEPGCAIGDYIPLGSISLPKEPGRYAMIPMYHAGAYSGWLAGSAVRFEIRRDGSVGLVNEPKARLSAGPASPPTTAPADPEWRAAVAMAARPDEHFVLRSFLSPVNRGKLSLIASMRVTLLGRWSRAATVPVVGDLPGGHASDYKILVRDARGAPVPMTDAGRSWVARQELSVGWTPKAGDSFGFVFPLREMFPLSPGKSYSVLVVVPPDGKNFAGGSSEPMTVRVPEPLVAGVTRPSYASGRVWPKFLARAGRPVCGMSERVVISRSGSQDDALSSPTDARGVDAVLSLRNDSDKWANDSGDIFSVDAQGAIVFLGVDRPVFLLRDEAGRTVPPNESVKGMAYHEAFGCPVPLAPGKSTPGDRFPLGLAFDLRPGAKYTLLVGGNLRSAGKPPALIVVRPLTFTAPSPDPPPAVTPTHAARPASDARDAVRDAPAATTQTWESLARFAGKEFEGLQFEAKASAPAAKPDEAMTLSVALHNCGKEPILVKKWKGESDYEILIRDATGREVPLTEKGKKFFETGDQLDTRELKPGEAINATLPLSELFDLKTPGQYTVLASLPVLGDVDAVLTASPIKLEIKPDEAHK